MGGDQVQIDILMKDYATMRDEVLLHFRNTKLHLKHFQAFMAAGLAVTWYLFFVADPKRLQEFVTAIGIGRGDLILYITFGLDIISYYFAFDILDSYYCIFLAAARLSNIEDQINGTWGRRLLVWEKFQQEPFAIFGGSRVAISAYQLFLIAVVSLAIPLICYVVLSTVDVNNLKHRGWLWVAVIFCIGAFLWFLYAFYDVFAFRRKESLHVIAQVVAGAKVETKSPLARLLQFVLRLLSGNNTLK